jgi:hypothetical protein
MADAMDRVLVLERQVQRAIELIERLRADNHRLAEERTALATRVEALAAEVARLRQHQETVERLEGDHRRLLGERRELLDQVEAMLKELSRIETG